MQTERAAHEAWAELVARAPVAARLMHLLVANMDAASNALVASQSTLGKLLGVHRNTVRKALQVLESENWIEIVELGGKGGALGYVVNSRVAWARSREDMRFAMFRAQVIASGDEQRRALEGRPKLRKVPVLQPGERQLPAGQGQQPPAQPTLPNLEPDLPEIREQGDEA